MAPGLSQNLIHHLAEIGASERFEDGEKIPSLLPFARSGSFMRLAPQSWYAVANELDDAQLIACIKTLTGLERLPNFSAGSVSPVIWLFRKLSERSHDDLDPVLNRISSTRTTRTCLSARTISVLNRWKSYTRYQNVLLNAPQHVIPPK